VNLDRMKKVVGILDGQEMTNGGYFEMQHDIIYLPWGQKDGDVAKKLEEAGCFWDSDTDSWASF
jgi:hypothetical protein